MTFVDQTLNPNENSQEHNDRQRWDPAFDESGLFVSRTQSDELVDGTLILPRQLTSSISTGSSTITSSSTNSPTFSITKSDGVMFIGGMGAILMVGAPLGFIAWMFWQRHKLLRKEQRAAQVENVINPFGGASRIYPINLDHLVVRKEPIIPPSPPRLPHIIVDPLVSPTTATRRDIFTPTTATQEKLIDNLSIDFSRSPTPNSVSSGEIEPPEHRPNTP